ncbi:MAG: SDR family oxidoreductase, partial [Chitinophagaceae bacterium]|nr:SDR family oxidoreductase [Chitinophagaceae bacterium]
MSSTILITGASSGIGLELSRVCASHKHDVILVARSGELLNGLSAELQEEFKIQAHVLSIDLTKENAALEIVAWCVNRNLSVDILVNNAGLGDFGFFHESEWQRQRDMIDVNITALTQLTHAFLPQMIKRGNGLIVNIASTASFQPGPMMSVYYASKAYVLHFTEAIRNEVKAKGIKVMAVCPGITATGFQKVAGIKPGILQKGKKIPTAREIAIYIYEAMMTDKPIAIPGFMNKLMTSAYRFLPRGLLVKIARSIQD